MYEKIIRAKLQFPAYLSPDTCSTLSQVISKISYTIFIMLVYLLVYLLLIFFYYYYFLILIDYLLFSSHSYYKITGHNPNLALRRGYLNCWAYFTHNGLCLLDIFHPGLFS